jgi:HrpA-like RNA helicase
MQDFRWTNFAHRLFFGKNGIAPFKKYSSEYEDFVLFFSRFQKARGASDHESHYREALQLFLQYQAKVEAEKKLKISKDRESLPIKEHEKEIVDAVKNHRVVLIAAETGAGKSTQVPQYLMEAGFDRIACTQPRRIACSSLARRVTYESLNRYGNAVGYQIRFDKAKSAGTKVLFLTEGILLRQYSSDPLLQMYNIIIIDEVHERHITGDFLLAILQKLLQTRSDLKIVLMSATINITLLQNYFSAPIIQVPGRLYPVRVHYLPIDEEDTNLTNPSLVSSRNLATFKDSVPARASRIKALPYLRILERIDQEYSAIERGDLLIFVSGLTEISILSEELRKYATHTRYLHLMLKMDYLGITFYPSGH